MSEIVNLSRRQFLRNSALAGGGLILGVHLLSSVSRGADAIPATSPSNATTFNPNAFVRVGSDDTVTVIVNHSEMGQGTYTSVAMIIADEMDADWSKVRAESAPVDPAYNHPIFGIQMTGGSTSTWTEFDRLRKAGAAARMMLVSAAAATWSVDASTCRAEKGEVIHDASGKRARYGELVPKAADLKPPQDVPLKDRKDFKIIGKATKRIDTAEKTNGTGIFGIDVNLPGMLVALVARPPVFGGKVKSFNADKAKAIAGVKQVMQIDRGIAVVADGFWPAKKGREALEIVWDDGPLANLDSKTQGEEYAKLASQPGKIARKEGDAAGAMGSVAQKFDAVYELPYLAHAPMEPINCVADVREDSCEIYTGTQFQTVDRNTAAAVLGMKPEKVKLHTTLLGGGFGRRAVPDSHFVVEAVQISKAVKAPVKVIWTREDDTRGGFYRPRAYHTISAALDKNNQPLAWQHRIVCQSFVVGTPFESAVIKDGVDETAVEGGKDIPYAIPNIAVDWQMAPSGVPTLWLRSVGHSHNAFVVETFIDELAHAAGRDPFEFRRGLLGAHPRHKRVLETVAEKSGWGSPLPAGRGRGIALHDSFGSYLAHVAEVSVSKAGRIHVHKVHVAIDSGPIVNPEIIRAQMEGATIFGMTAALYGEISFENGRVKQSNFHDYPMVRMLEAPQVEVHIVPSEDKMGGVGEPGVPPVAPAIANAIFAVTGKRVRRLPMNPADLVA